jgi:hypothetical protein
MLVLYFYLSLSGIFYAYYIAAKLCGGIREINSVFTILFGFLALCAGWILGAYIIFRLLMHFILWL